MKRIYEDAAYRREVGSYWETTVAPPRFERLSGDTIADVAVIGAGYVGMNAALELAETHGLSVALVDACQPGWGASGRNGGFACMGGSKLDWTTIRKRFGDEATRRFFAFQSDSIETVRENLSRYVIDAEVHSNGEVQLAHRERDMETLRHEAGFMESFFGVKPRLIEKRKLADEGLSSGEFHGASEFAAGFALNPLKYVSGLARAVKANAGISGFGESAVRRIRSEGGKWRLECTTGSIVARKVLIATNGYSSEDVPDWLAGRLLPVLTQIIVTRPLTRQELDEQGWTSFQMCYDTRHLLHYFRLMPDINGEGPRMLFGMRGGLSAKTAPQMRMHMALRRDFERFFPAWRHVETPHYWSGLACLSSSLSPYAGPVPGMDNVYAALAWHGNGVALGSHTGRRIAAMVAGDQGAPSLPAPMRQIPRRFPFPPFRRIGLAGAYRWLALVDR
ncbi:MAG: FAD-binding oxidoreductase [Nitratireductor sp.]|nr:FAD-binding oxidoreductase [Nitratireductor sp.]